MPEKIICYLGPSLDLETAVSILPEAIYLPPIKHADLISDIPKYNPTHILIIDGRHTEEIPVWHKECSFAALKGIRVYGASSMGALRASELADHGVMIGVGKIFNWYWEGVIDADDEVALLYNSHNGKYYGTTTPLVNYRAGLLDAIEDGVVSPEEAGDLFKEEQRLNYRSRIALDLTKDQKKLDAIELLTNFRAYNYCTTIRPTTDYVTSLFTAMVERERRVDHLGATITMQNIDSYVSLHSPDHDQIAWDSKNRSLALILADLLHVSVTPKEIESEWVRFCAHHHLESWDHFLDWLKSNVMSNAQFDILTIQNARIRKLQNAYVTTAMFRRQTQTILDYMRTHNTLGMWLDDCADEERSIVDSHNEEAVSIDMLTPLESLLEEHFNHTGLEISGSLNDFLRETGIGAVDELRVCLQRSALARKTRSD